MLEVEMSLHIASARVEQPVNLIGPSADTQFSKSDLPGKETCHVILTVPEIQVQLRVHDFYMGVFAR